MFDAVLADAGIETVLTGIRMPRMNSIMERWVQTCRRELLDRTLIWNQPHASHPEPGRAAPPAARSRHRPGPLPWSRRRDRAGGVIHEYRLVA
jgi:putative transposase